MYKRQQGAVLGGGVHQLLAGVAHHLTVVFHGIEVVGNLGQGAVVALVGEGGLPLLAGQHSSGLGLSLIHISGMAQLLRKVQELHSLRAAAMSMNMAYSKAWTITKKAQEDVYKRQR